MTPDEVIRRGEAGELVAVEGVDPSTAKLHGGDGPFSVGGLVVVPIEAVGSLLDRSLDIELLDEAGASVGTICFTRNLVAVHPGALTKWQYAAFLAEGADDWIGPRYDFSRDHVVIDEAFVDDYLARYSIGAPIWGGFTHEPLPPREVAPQVGSIRGNPAIHLPTEFHRQALNRYIEATNAFDRFLKLYHTLELLFDYVIMKRMKQVGDDLENFGKILAEYDRSELERLKYLIREFCTGPADICSGFSEIHIYQDRATEIFQNHTKTGNPFHQEARWQEFLQLAADDKLSEIELQKAKFVNPNVPFSVFISSVAAYWIYRVRSSIAHSRVGEFLFVESDEKFVADFAEPLLLDVVMQVFENSDLKALTAI
jgi:hypothetical protein